MSLLGEILSTTETADLEGLRDALCDVNEKIEILKSELVCSLQSSFAIVDSDVDKVTSWFLEVEGVNTVVQELKEQLRHEKLALSISEEEVNFVRDEIVESTTNIKILKELVQVVQNLENAEPCEIFMAAKRLQASKDGLDSIISEFSHDLSNKDWIIGLQSSVMNKINETYTHAFNEWNLKFQFEKNLLLVHPELGKGHVPSLVEALRNLKYYPKVMERFSSQVWQELLSKAASPEYTVKYMRPEKSSRKSMGPGRIIKTEIPVREKDVDRDPASPDLLPDVTLSNTFVIQLRKLDTPIESVKDVFENIKQVLLKLNEVFFDCPMVMQDLSAVVGNKLVSQLSNKCLTSLILQQSGGLKEKARENIIHLHEFRNALAEMNFHIPDERVLDDYERNFDVLFMKQVQEDILADVRRLIKMDIHQTIEYFPNDLEVKNEIDLDDPLVLHRNPFTQQPYVISRSVAEIVEILSAHLAHYPDDIQLIAHALNLFISIVKIPTHESDNKDFIPLTAVLTHNNCMYLSNHAEVSFPMSEDKIPLLRTKANHAFAFMMRSVRTKLNGMIATAMVGLDQDIEINYAERQIKFLEIAAEFDRLDNIFANVLPQRTWRSALATLVDHTVNEMCSKVLSWEDISAATGNELASSFTAFAVHASKLFKREGVSAREADVQASKNVTKWQRFRLLTFVLTATMVEIGDRWVNGCGPLAACFTAEEIRKLVRALFQNTDRRAAFLASIK